jgi:hypothetical protein
METIDYILEQISKNVWKPDWYKPLDKTLAHKWNNNKPNVVLLSYPRSGNTWTRYALEFLSKQPSLGTELNNTFNRPIGSMIDMGVDLDEDVIVDKKHIIRSEDSRETPMILLLRNYKECILRHQCYKDNKELKDNWKNIFKKDLLEESREGYYLGYMKGVQCFDKWPAKKLLVYYEDLISDQHKTLKQILNFLEISDQHLDSFVKDLDVHKKISVSMYSYWSPSRTKGDNAKYHSSNISKDDKLEIDNMVKEKYPVLYKKYLTRYGE